MSTTASSRRVGEHRVFAAIAALAALIVFAGFAPTYYLKHWFDTPELNLVAHAHGLAFTSWLLLFATQIGLVATGRTHIHRRLGIVGALVALLMLVLGFELAIESARLGHTPVPGLSPLAFMAIPIFNIVGFALLVSSALLLRGDPSAHKRLMVLATIAVVAPGMARLPFDFIVHGGPPVFFALTDLLVLLCIAWEAFSRGKVHSTWLRGGLLLLASQVTPLLLANTEAWLVFAAWLAG